jgi:GxxExxY protein
MSFAPVSKEVQEVARIVVDAAIKVHTHLGPGLVESAYKSCLIKELRLRGVLVELEVPYPVVYEGEKLNCGYRADMVAGNSVIVEVKAVDAIHPIFEAQVLTYLKLSGLRLGLLLNFNVLRMKDGIRRFIR